MEKQAAGERDERWRERRKKKKKKKKKKKSGGNESDRKLLFSSPALSLEALCHAAGELSRGTDMFDAEIRGSKGQQIKSSKGKDAFAR